MNFSDAINIVLNEAESSALGECSSEGAEVLEACEVFIKKGFPTGDVDFGTSME